MSVGTHHSGLHLLAGGVVDDSFVVEEGQRLQLVVYHSCDAQHRDTYIHEYTHSTQHIRHKTQATSYIQPTHTNPGTEQGVPCRSAPLKYSPLTMIPVVPSSFVCVFDFCLTCQTTHTHTHTSPHTHATHTADTTPRGPTKPYLLIALLLRSKRRDLKFDRCCRERRFADVLRRLHLLQPRLYVPIIESLVLQQVVNFSARFRNGER